MLKSHRTATNNDIKTKETFQLQIYVIMMARTSFRVNIRSIVG